MKNSIAFVLMVLAVFACKDVQKEVMVDANQPEEQIIDSISGMTTAPSDVITIMYGRIDEQKTT